MIFLVDYSRAGKEQEVERLELQAKSFASGTDKEIQLLGIKSGVKVLDAGCGTGSFCRRIAKLVLPAMPVALQLLNTLWAVKYSNVIPLSPTATLGWCPQLRRSGLR